MDVKKEKPNPKMTIGCSQKQKVMIAFYLIIHLFLPFNICNAVLF